MNTVSSSDSRSLSLEYYNYRPGKKYHRRARKRNKKIFSHEYRTGSVIGSAAAFPQQHHTDKTTYISILNVNKQHTTTYNKQQHCLHAL
jgi:hypothetical protein